MFLVEYYPPDINVAGIRISEMVSEFSKKKGVSVRVVVFNPEKRAARHKAFTSLAENVDCVRYGRRYLPGAFHLMGLLNPFTMMCWCYYTTVQTYLFKPDVIIATVPSIIPSISADMTSRITRTPFCIDMRDNWVNGKAIDYFIDPLPGYVKSVYRVLFRPVHNLYIKSCKDSAIISTVYDNLAFDIRKYVDSSKAVVHIPNGINPEELERVRKAFDKKELLDHYHIPCRDGAKYIIFTGVIGGYYKPEVLLGPMIELKKKGHDIIYILVGEGNKKDTIRQMAKDSGLTE
jgi:glycosyltransferase involved in cell wall biosynthesis